MKIRKEDLLRVNAGFGGNLRKDASLDFALDKQNDNALGKYKKIAYLLRAILVDPPFSDGNKRTATFLCMAFSTEEKLQVDNDLLIHQIVSIAKNNITEIRNIADRIKTAIK
jgi:prophage maintenance system killer protein